MGKIYKQLSIEERALIQTQLAMGVKPAAIAMGLNRSASTNFQGAAAERLAATPSAPNSAGDQPDTLVKMGLLGSQFSSLFDGPN